MVRQVDIMVLRVVTGIERIWRQSKQPRCPSGVTARW
jgi:hypothetical protein